MNKFLKKIALFLCITFALGILLTLSQPYLYSFFYSDFKRHLLLNNTLTNTNKNPDIIFFGDSRTMYGVDAHLLSSLKDKNILTYNLSSVSQSIFEASYFYSLVNKSTKIVIQGTDISWFNNDRKPFLSDNKAYSMILSGYEIENETTEILRNINPLFYKNYYINYFNSRYYMRNYIHNYTRQILDSEKFDRSQSLDLYFPSVYVRPKQPGYPAFSSSCSDYNFKNVPQQKIIFLKKIVQFFRKKNIDFYLLLNPVNPDLCNISSLQDYKIILNAINEISDLEIIDATTLLDEAYFYDDKHPNKSGAEILSKFISTNIEF